jgi:D-tyrosyl-tRNA(Tyr) deacylase
VRALLQRVTGAAVQVGDETVGRIGSGLLLLVGVTHTDDVTSARRLAARVAHLRVFDDESGVMNRSLREVGGEALVVSQFTLYADTSRGRRPSWSSAARPDHAGPLVEAFVAALRDLVPVVATGRFGTRMRVALENDGPVTLLVEA